jgi:hypothetical protein
MLTKQFEEIVDLTAEAFSKPPESEMLKFLQRKDKGYYASSEGWFQTEIARKFDAAGFEFTFKGKKKRDCDFLINGVAIELKVSTSFSYKGTRRLFDAITHQHKGADCWMFITKRDQVREREMFEEKLWAKYDHLPTKAIENTDWCIILVTRKTRR